MKRSGSTTTRQITTINHATEEVINTYEIMAKEQINEKTKLRMRILIGNKIYRKEQIIFMISLKN